MIIQESTRANTEVAWVNVLNVEGATLTTHWPVMRIQGPINANSVGAALDAALPTTAISAAGVGGGVIGLADEDIPAGDVGLVQVYGYHESVLVANLNTTAVTVVPGSPIGQIDNANSVGVSSLAKGTEAFAIALDTIGGEHSGDGNYANHVFIRAC